MKHIRNLLLASVALRAFDPGKSGWKLDANGKIEMKDGNPIFIDANGGELTLGTDTITRLNGEAKALRTRAEKAEGDLKGFEGLDPALARKAIDTVSKLDAKKLIDAGEVEKVREEIKKSYDGQIAEKDAALGKVSTELSTLRKTTAFSTSKFVQERVAVPAEMFQNTFGNYFKEEEGKLVAYYPHGEKVFSKKRAGEVADFDEALELLTGNYAHKDSILKAPNNSGSGNGGGGGGRGGNRTITRADFDKLNPVERGAHAQLAGKGELTIVD